MSERVKSMAQPLAVLSEGLGLATMYDLV